MTAFSHALDLYERSDFTGAAQMMAPVVHDSPTSMLVRVAFDQIRRRAAASAADKAKDRIKSGLGGMPRRP